MCLQCLDSRVGGEKCGARQHVPEDSTDAVKVRDRPHILLSIGLLRREVIHCPQDTACCRQRRIRGAPGKPEIKQHNSGFGPLRRGPGLGHNKKVGRLDIPVDHAGFMGSGERLKNTFQDAVATGEFLTWFQPKETDSLGLTRPAGLLFSATIWRKSTQQWQFAGIAANTTRKLERHISSDTTKVRHLVRERQLCPSTNALNSS